MRGRVVVTIALLTSAAASASGRRVHSIALPKTAPVTVPEIVKPSLAAMAPEQPAPEATVTPEPFTVLEESALNLKVEHAFSKETARERVAELLAYWQERFGLKSEWRGFRVFLTGKVLGIAIRALFEIEDRDVVAMAQDPGTIFSGAARRYVDAKLRKYLSPSYEEP